jgi:ubiquinone/menaquinone biosynthesis C-methylase UbiE
MTQSSQGAGKPSDAFCSWTTSGQSAGMERRHRFLWQAVANEAGFVADSRILDLGCGEGWAASLASEIASDGVAVGLDASPAMIDVAATKHGHACSVVFMRGDAHALPFAASHFSHVFSIEALYYIADLDQVAAEIHRVLVPGGRFLCAINYFADNPYTRRWTSELQIPIYNRSADEHRRVFAAAGFASTRVARVHDPAPLPTRYEGRWFHSLEDRIAFQKEGALVFVAER